MRSISKHPLSPRGLLATLGLFIALVTTPLSSEAASCCGGGFATPALITGDEKATFSAELSTSTLATDVSANGIWKDRAAVENLETFKIQAAHIFFDRFQFGGSLPIIRRARAGDDSTGLGDAAFNLGYEVLPEWEYSAWRPRGVSYLTLVTPTGRSIQDASNSLQLDARGRGFWSLGIGTTLTKVFGRFDTLASLEVHRSFAREVKTSTLEGELRPGFGGTASIGTGYNFLNTRVGANLTFNYEDPIETRGSVSSQGSLTRFATAAISVSQMFGEDWAVSLAVSDQSLFGAPSNTALAKAIAITAQHRLSR